LYLFTGFSSLCSWVGGGWVVWLGVMGIAIDKLDADLLGEGQLNLLASWLSQGSDTLLNRLNGILNLWDSDALVLSEVFAADNWESNWLVNAGLDGFWVGDSHININGGHNRDVVLGGLGNLIAVVMAITMCLMSVSISTMTSWLANSDHLHIFFLLKSDLNSLGGGGLLLLLVAVGADFVGDLHNGLSADSPGDIVAELLVNDLLDGQLNISANLLEGWCAHLGNLSHVLNSAVVLGLLIAIPLVAISWGSMVTVGRGSMVTISWGSMVTVGWGSVVGRGGMIG